MKILDENGVLFGVVNAIDALVVGVLCAVGDGAYLAFDTDPTLPSGGTDMTKPADATRFATLSLGTHDEYLARQFDSGDVVLETEDGSRAVVTDVFQSPRGARSSVTVRVRLEGTVEGGSFLFNGSTLAVSDSLTLTSLRVSETVTAVDETDSSLAVDETDVLPRRASIPVEKAPNVQVGDGFVVAGQTVAEVKTVRAYPSTEAGGQRVYIGVTLQTMNRLGRPAFAGQSLISTIDVSLRLDDVTVTAPVVRVGTVDLPGEDVERSVTVELRRVAPSTANALSVGDSEVLRNDTHARVTDVSAEPTTVVTRSESGEIFEREHPRLKTVELIVRVEACRGPDGNLYFHNNRLREGQTLLLDLDSILIDGVVLEVESPGANATTSQATVDGLPTAIEARLVATANEVKR